MNSSDNQILPTGHKPVPNGNPENCPYLQISQGIETKNGEIPSKKNKVSSKKNDDSDLSEEETQGLQGSCPFMSTGINRRNPDLAHFELGYDIDYISKMKDLIKSRGMYKKEEFDSKRSLFNKYPIYLQETLFFNDEQMKKLRKLEIPQRFFLCDEWRERGNRHFHKENYQRALYYYTLCLAAFRWLELGEIDKGMKTHPDSKDPKKREILEKFKKMEVEKENTVEVDEKEEEESEEDEEEEKTIKNDDIFEESKEYIEYKAEEENKAFEEKYKLFLSIYTDQNVKLCDEKELTDESDIDLRKSFMVNLYLNIAVCCMKMKHFSLALQSLEDAEELSTDKVSLIYFRKSQVLLYNKSSSFLALQEAKKFIEKALEIKKTEKIFLQKKEYLKIINLHNAQEIYEEHLIRVNETINKKIEDDCKDIKNMLIKVKDRYFVDSILGKDKKSNINENSTMVDIKTEEQDFALIRIMKTRYLRMIEFFQQTKKKEEELRAKKELEFVKAVLCRMHFFYDLDFKNYMNDPLIKEAKKDINLDLSNPEILKLLNSEKHKRMQEIFENAEFNMEILNYALREYLQKQEKSKKRNKQKSCCGFDNIEKKETSWKKMMNVNTLFKIVLLIIVIVVVFTWHQNSKTVGMMNFPGKRKF